MFYSTELLGKKSPMGLIWIAAHGKKLLRGKVQDIDIGKSCDSILQPEVPQALRLQAILMGGVVILYTRQQHFLLEDCKDVMKRMQAVAAAKEVVDITVMQRGRTTARPEAITLPQVDIETAGPLTLLGPLGSEEDSILLDHQYSGGEDLFIAAPGSQAFSTANGSRRTGSDYKHMPPLQDDMPYNDLPFASGMGGAGMFDQDLTFDQNGGDGMDFVAPPDFMDLGGGPDFGDAAAFSPARTAGPLPAADYGNPLKEDSTPPMQQQSPMPISMAINAPARKRKKQRTAAEQRHMNLMLDAPEATVVGSKEYWGWQVNRGDLLTNRPTNAVARRMAAALPSLTGGPMALAVAATADAAPRCCARQLLDAFRFVTQEDDIYDVGAAGGAEAGALQEDGMLPRTGVPMGLADDGGYHGDGGFPDMPDRSPSQQDAFLVARPAQPPWSDTSVERLRAALNSPGGSHTLMRGTPATDGSGLASARKGVDRRHSRTLERVPSLSDRSASLSGCASPPGGRMDDFLPPIHEDDLQGMATSQYQLLEETGTEGGQPSAPAILPVVSAPVLGVLQQHFEEKEEAACQAAAAVEGLGQAHPGDEARLSLKALTRGLTRIENARMFSQICSVTAVGFLHAEQRVPLGDIILTRGAAMPACA